MKAIVYTKFGSPDVLQCKEVETPTPKEKQVLIKVQAASLNKLDQVTYAAPLLIRLLTGNGVFTPKNQRIGTDLAGRVEAIGSAVTQFRVGDEVFGGGQGSFAEYACVREDALVLKPANITFQAAATIPVAGLTALQGLRDNGHLQAGQKVLIYGAGGGVGSFAVQIAKAFGAEVTAVCGTGNVEMVRSIGADQTIDYTQEDFSQHGARYDLILAVNGHQSMQRYQRALQPSGRCIVVGGSFRQVGQSLLHGALLSRLRRQKIAFMGIAKFNQPDLVTLKELVETGKITPVIDRCYPLSETAEALRYFEKGHTRGKVVVTMG